MTSSGAAAALLFLRLRGVARSIFSFLVLVVVLSMATRAAAEELEWVGRVFNESLSVTLTGNSTSFFGMRNCSVNGSVTIDVGEHPPASSSSNGGTAGSGECRVTISGCTIRGSVFIRNGHGGGRSRGCQMVIDALAATGADVDMGPNSTVDVSGAVTNYITVSSSSFSSASNITRPLDDVVGPVCRIVNVTTGQLGIADFAHGGRVSVDRLRSSHVVIENLANTSVVLSKVQLLGSLRVGGTLLGASVLVQHSDIRGSGVRSGQLAALGVVGLGRRLRIEQLGETSRFNLRQVIILAPNGTNIALHKPTTLTNPYLPADSYPLSGCVDGEAEGYGPCAARCSEPGLGVWEVDLLDRNSPVANVTILNRRDAPGEFSTCRVTLLSESGGVVDQWSGWSDVERTHVVAPLPQPCIVCVNSSGEMVNSTFTIDNSTVADISNFFEKRIVGGGDEAAFFPLNPLVLRNRLRTTQLLQRAANAATAAVGKGGFDEVYNAARMLARVAVLIAANVTAGSAVVISGGSRIIGGSVHLAGSLKGRGARWVMADSSLEPLDHDDDDESDANDGGGTAAPGWLISGDVASGSSMEVRNSTFTFHILFHVSVVDAEIHMDDVTLWSEEDTSATSLPLSVFSPRLFLVFVEPVERSVVHVGGFRGAGVIISGINSSNIALVDSVVQDGVIVLGCRPRRPTTAERLAAPSAEVSNVSIMIQNVTSARNESRGIIVNDGGGRSAVSPSAYWDQILRVPTVARYVRIVQRANARISMVQVQVFSFGKDVSSGRVATQSSTYPGNLAGYCVDGSVEPLVSGGCNSRCCTEYGAGQWWIVDLGQPRAITSVVVTNRAQNYHEQFSSCELQLLGEHPNLGSDALNLAKLGPLASEPLFGLSVPRLFFRPLRRLGAQRPASSSAALRCDLCFFDNLPWANIAIRVTALTVFASAIIAKASGPVEPSQVPWWDAAVVRVPLLPHPGDDIPFARAAIVIAVGLVEGSLASLSQLLLVGGADLSEGAEGSVTLPPPAIFFLDNLTNSVVHVEDVQFSFAVGTRSVECALLVFQGVTTIMSSDEAAVATSRIPTPLSTIPAPVIVRDSNI